MGSRSAPRAAQKLSPSICVKPQNALRLKPYIWKEVNLLHLAPESFADALARLAEGLPLEFHPPAAHLSLDAMDGEPWRAPSMDEEIARQLSLCPVLHGRLANVERWCELLDRRGYLNASPRDAARAFGVGERAFREALAHVRSWVEPAGFFAADLADCLLLQLARLGASDSDAAFLLRSGRDELERGTLETFCGEHDWSAERLRSALRALRRLDPNPGYAFAGPQGVVPELAFVVEGDTVLCRVMDENLPRLSLLPAWPGEGAALKEARALLSRVERRRLAIARIGMFLARAQGDYLSTRADAPTALSLRTVSEATGLHVSTLSRCFSAHWAMSPRGVLRLSSLLVRSLTNRKGESRMSYADLERAIRSGVGEGLRDAALAQFLGIPRRTVAYHRLRLGL